MLSNQVNILVLILLSDFRITSTRDQFIVSYFVPFIEYKLLLVSINTESEVQIITYIILKHPFQIFKVIRINSLNVMICNFNS
uniref:Uncharacterized protein n=1 Tax=Rhizophora mucronata TaxID=61149 RepID=A0A2P2MUX7_RHIMU